MLLLTDNRTLFRFPKFSRTFFFCTRIPSRILHYVFCHRIIYLVVMFSQAPLRCDNFSHFSCFWWPWQFWGLLVRRFVDCPSIGISLMFFSWLDVVIGFGEKDHRAEVPFSSRHNQRCMLLTLITRAEVVLARFLHCKVQVTLPPLSILCSLADSPYAQPTRKGWTVMLNLLEGGDPLL